MQPASTATETCNNTSSEATGRLFLARNDKLDADIAAALLKGEGQGKSGPLAYLFSVAITAEDWNAAHAVGAARTAIAKARGRTSGQYRRGADDERIDTEGALAELASFEVFGRAADYCAPLVEYKPNRQGLDLGVGGEHYDVKSISQSKSRCCINRAQHFEKRPRGYICVRIVSERILDVYYVAATDVEAWRVFTGYTPYFAANLPAAIPLPLTEDEPAC